MNFRQKRACWLAYGLFCVAVMSGCASSPAKIPAPCPSFPPLPQELLQPPPTLYLIPQALRPVSPVSNLPETLQKPP